jgi:hypothetical protein
MRIQIVEMGKVSKHTNGPPNGNYFEMMADGIHCNPTQIGGFRPTPIPPLMPGYCLTSYF